MKIYCPDPACAQKIKIDVSDAGTVGVCPACGCSFVCPAVEEFPTEELPPPEPPKPVSIEKRTPARPVAKVEPGCQPPSSVQITVEIPANETWWQIEVGEGDYPYFKKLEEVRALLLQGRITRHHYCRELTAPPVEGTDVDAYKTAVAKWEASIAWMKIGDGLAKKRHPIEVIYDPVGAYMRSTETNFAAVVCITVFVLFIVVDARAGWPVGGTIFSLPDSLFSRPATTVSKADMRIFMLIGLVILAVLALVYLGLAAVVAVLSAFLIAPVGAGIGRLIGRMREKKEVQAPADGFAGRTYREEYTFLPAILAAVLLAVVAGLGWWFLPRVRTAFKPALAVAAVTDGQKGVTAYTDPKGRFSCELPPGWRAEDKAGDVRSNVRFIFGRDEIRVIARDTGRHVLDESDRKEMSDMMEGILKQARARGGKGNLQEVKLTSIEGRNALDMSLQIDVPEYLRVRQIKFKESASDHLIGLYVSSRGREAELMKQFEAFLRSYRSSVKP